MLFSHDKHNIMEWFTNRLELVQKSVTRRMKCDSRMKQVLGIRRDAERIGMLTDMVKDAVAGAPIGMFNGEVYAWTGRIYEKVSQEELSSMVYEVLMSCNASYADMTKTSVFVKVAFDFLSRKQLTPQKSIMVFNNGVYDIERGTLEDFGPRYVQMWQVGYDYNKDDVAVMWQKFLSQVLPDLKSRSFLQEFLGAAFVSREKASIEKMLILLGAGANGKSVIYRVLQDVLGIDNVTSLSVGSLINGNDAEKNVASINGKRLNYCSEIETAVVKYEYSDTLKKLISGEPLSAKVLYRNPFPAREIPLMMANANALPRLADKGYAIRRRFAVIKFGVQIPRRDQDPLLADKLKTEASGIFNWIMEGRSRFVLRGFRLPPYDEPDLSVDDTTLIGLPTVEQWLVKSGYVCDSSTSLHNPVWMRVGDLYKAYAKWCMDERTVPDSMQRFGKILRSHGFEKRRDTRGCLYGMKGSGARSKAGGIASECMLREKREATMWYDSDGSALILGETRLSYALGVSRKVIRRFVANGKKEGYRGKDVFFEGVHYEHSDGAWKSFNVDKCRERLAENEIYANEDRRKEMVRVRARENTERRKFNTAMRNLGLPYRKNKHHGPLKEDGCVLVDDGMTVEEAMLESGMQI